ncbi:ABC transporter substrate-binding protein [Methyloglobulus morosus KoM1]|uniref:ABC transporter substrate-binding protein n=2 Tax=Methyloglobulus TaxID=1410680 RepID=V5C1J1_9GAMM|nr:ABC transporter substrate-binding protein [Methyloglobulus morosus KoM1]
MSIKWGFRVPYINHLMKTYVLLLGFYLLATNGFASDKTTIRIGVQPTGTLAWELSVLQTEDNAKNLDFNIETHPIATSEAGKIALQSGAVDVIVSDWIWVSKARSEGNDFTFYPYSTTSGSLIVPESSPILTIKDLKGKRLGIAGGELDKNWLLLQTLAQQAQLDLNTSVEKVFGAPPLINEQLKQGRVDAALNYWHYGAKLEAQGYRQVIDGKGLLKGLGIPENVPALGYVFKQSWATGHKKGVDSFFQASKKAKQLLCASEPDWKKIIPLIQADDMATQTKLRQRYCEGEVTRWGAPEQQAAERIYTLLRKVSNNLLTGKSEHLQPGTFWSQD